MKKAHRYIALLSTALLLTAFSACGSGEQSETKAPNAKPSETGESALIDAHAHLYLEDWNDQLESAFIAMNRKDNYRWLNICTHGLRWSFLQKQVEISADLSKRYPGIYSWATSFNLENWDDPDWEEKAIEYLADSFDKGAVAVKIWKEVGMELKDPDGSYVMIDDPRFDPVLDYIEQCGKALVCHLGEPRNCWLPLEDMTVNGDRNYFKNHPEYHAYKHPEIPSYEEQIAARDRMLEKHPGLTVIGCHLGSLEYDTDRIAVCLDKHPNFAVDMAARIIHFKVQDREKVRDFLIKYQDRVLYATDIIVSSTDNIDTRMARISETHRDDYRYFSTAEDFTIDEREEPVRGLDLPGDILDKLFRDNTCKWYGI